MLRGKFEQFSQMVMDDTMEDCIQWVIQRLPPNPCTKLRWQMRLCGGHSMVVEDSHTIGDIFKDLERHHHSTLQGTPLKDVTELMLMVQEYVHGG